MYCPECGNDAGSAKFCPECGADLAGVQDALSGKTGAAKAARQGGGAAAAKTAATTTGGPKRISPAVIWGGFGALAVVVIVIVVMVSGGFGGGGSGDDTTANASGAPVQAVNADTSGSYERARRPRQRPLRPGRQRVPEPELRAGRRLLRRRRQGLRGGVEEAGHRAQRGHRLRGRAVLQRRHPRRAQADRRGAQGQSRLPEGLAQQGHLPQPRGSASPSRAATRRPPRSCSPRRRPRSPRRSPSTPSPMPASRPTRACSSCSSSSAGFSRVQRPPGRDTCRRPRTVKARRGRPAQSGRHMASRERHSLAQATSATTSLRDGAVTARALGREPPRAAPAPRAPGDPRAAPDRRLLLRLAAA